MAKILLTTTSYQDTPGPHHDLLNGSGHEVQRERGPLSEQQMLDLVGDFDAFLCGDDAITRKVLEKASPKLKIIAKYGIGVDKIDVEAATEMGMPICFTPGVNHTTVAEHSFGLMLALFRNLVEEVNYVRAGQWKRITGHEIMGKTIGIIGLGRIGKEMVIRAKAFGLNVIGNDLYWPEEFAAEHGVERAETFDEIFEKADIISLHTNLTAETRDLISAKSMAKMKDGVIILNCARGELVNTADMVEGLKSGKIGGYGADVLDEEPPSADHPLLSAPHCVITPHIGSRTHESVQRQAIMATKNLLLCLEGKPPLAQINDVPVPALD
ncbi:phosphoglycerate dehydrogenase [Ruficoccus sp. ZRK36]|uniref:phosphoglycerate dehydrogenase n=1 Tax=Ruficoccus sp. ZRK36 TaxID=2866311 RepID=UPI001C72D94E|nr:phosphoglycerate dehydrogenase [Ruficoccus sp. ZRK36]QYY34353.1 phosphoglycerate dehydrogenase [Ruficoccus sp. ZRK36]